MLTLAIWYSENNASLSAPEETVVDQREGAAAQDTEAVASSGIVEGRVARIVDGDSLHLVGIETQIRLWGVDAPEWNEPGGSHATETLRRLADAAYLKCEIMDRDRYGRIVARCFRTNGFEVNVAMIKSGAASEYVRYTDGYYRRQGLLR